VRDRREDRKEKGLEVGSRMGEGEVVEGGRKKGTGEWEVKYTGSKTKASSRVGDGYW